MLKLVYTSFEKASPYPNVHLQCWRWSHRNPDRIGLSFRTGQSRAESRCLQLCEAIANATNDHGAATGQSIAYYSNCLGLLDWFVLFVWFFFQEQYVFLYEALLEALKCGDTTVSCANFPQMLDDIERPASAAHKQMLKEFEVRTSKFWPYFIK